MPPGNRANSPRRALLKSLALLPLAVRTPPAQAARATARSVSFYHTHTGERLKVTYFENGRYISESLRAVNHLLRDFRTEEVHVIDRRLLDQLFALAGCCGGGTFEVISGYRSPATNSMLRETTNGVAAHSLHQYGRAIDVRLSGFDTAKLCEAAIGSACGGVGFYPKSNFVHLDTGRFRTWGPRAA